MRAVCFVPDDAGLRDALDAWLAKRPKTARIEWAALGADPRDALTEAIAAADKKHGFVIVDGPQDVESCRLIDEVCRAQFGRRGLPQGIFFAPRKGHDEWRAVAQPLHAHYHPDRRAVDFSKPKPKQLVKSVKAVSRARSILRWGALLPMSIVFLSMLAGVTLARDGLLHAAAESGLESAFAARAEIADLSSLLTTQTLELDQTQVADRRAPMRNLFQFDRFAGGIDVGQMFSGRVHIPELSLEGLRFGTARTESGALPGAPPPEPEPVVDAATAGPSFEEKLDGLLQALKPPELQELASVREAQAIEREARERLAALEKLVAESTLPARYAAAEARAKTLAKVEAPASFQAVASAAKELAALRPDPALLDGIRKDFDAAVPSFDAEQQQVAAARRDFESATSSVDAAKRVVADAKKIQKFSWADALKIKKLIEDLNKAQRGLSTGLTKLNRARNNVLRARASVEQRTADAAKRLQSGKQGLAEAQAILDKAGGDLPAKAKALSGSLAAARADLEAGKKQLEGALAQVQADLQAVQDEAAKLRTELEAGAALATGVPKRLADALQKDRDDLLQRYSLDRITSDELLGPVVGDSTVGWVRWVLANYEWILPLVLPGDEDSVASQVREHIGTVFSFRGDETTPARFWIGKMRFSGTLELDGKPFVLTGSADNISSNLAATAADAHVEFTAEYDGQKLRATIDVTRAGEVAVKLEVEGIKFAARLENRRIQAGFDQGRLDASIETRITPLGVTAAAKLKLDGLSVALGEGVADSQLAFLNDALKELRGVEAEVELGFSGGAFNTFRVHAGGGAGFAKAVRGALENQVKKASEAAFAEIDKRVAGPRKQAEAAAAEFLAKGKPAAEGLIASVSGGTGVIDQARTAALGNYAEMGKLLDAGADPAGAIEQARAATAKLRADAASLEGAAAQAAAEPLKAAEGALAVEKTSRAALDDIQKQITAEIARLTKLR